MSYHYRLYESADSEQVGGLLTRLWSRDPRLNESYLRWRYERNPYLKSLLAVCEQQGEIVAARGAYGMRWHIGDGDILIPCLGDTVVDKRHEGRGLVRGLTRLLFSELDAMGIEWVINQTPGPLIEKVSLRAGWRKVSEWTMTRAVNSKGVKDFSRLDANGPTTAESHGVRIRCVQPDADDLADLIRRCRTGHVAHAKDEAYFGWRFDNPFADYRWIGAWSDRLVGYIVLGRTMHKRWRTHILDLQGIDGTVQSLLLDRALRWGEFREVRVWWTRFPREVVNTLVEHNFVAADDSGRRRPRPLIASIQNAGTPFVVNDLDVLNAANWDPRMLQSDAT